MSYLILNDYYSQIQIQNLNQIIGSNTSLLTTAAQKAQEQCISYLIQKYDTTGEFTDTNVWDPTKIYYAKDRVYLDGPGYNTASNYNPGALCLQAGNVYYCISTATGLFDATKWNLIGPQYTMFYGTVPYPEFEVSGCYNIGDTIFYKNNIYTALEESIIIGNPTAIQYRQIQNLPLQNSFPDQPNQTQWSTPTPYQIPGGAPLNQYDYLLVLPGSAMISTDGEGNFVYTDPKLAGKTGYLVYPRQLNQYFGEGDIQYNEDGFTVLVQDFALVDELIIYPNTYSSSPTPPNSLQYWTQGDNRSQQLLEVMIDITLYKIHSRISPRNIPDLRVKNRDDAIDWLKDARKGEVTANLPLLQPAQGQRIRYGGNVKNINSY